MFKNNLFAATKRIFKGFKLYKRLIRKYGKNTHIFLIRGKTGDIYLYFRFMKAYLEANRINNYVLIGDGKNLNKIKQLYPYINADSIIVSELDGFSLQTIWCFFGGKNLNMDLSLMWDVDLFYNRCATRLTDNFNFIDSYYWFLFNLDRKNTKIEKAHFLPLSKDIESRLESEGVKRGKTVIISPVAYCVRLVSLVFWNLLAKNLEHRGYTVFFMLSKDEQNNSYPPPLYIFFLF